MKDNIKDLFDQWVKLGHKRKIILPKSNINDLNFDKLETVKKYKDDFVVNDKINFDKGNIVEYIKKLIKDDKNNISYNEYSKYEIYSQTNIISGKDIFHGIKLGYTFKDTKISEEKKRMIHKIRKIIYNQTNTKITRLDVKYNKEIIINKLKKLKKFTKLVKLSHFLEA